MSARPQPLLTMVCDVCRRTNVIEARRFHGWGQVACECGADMKAQFFHPAPSRRSLIVDKIMRRVVEEPCPALNDNCLIWTGPDSGTGRGGGYPRMSLDGGTVAVHIVMWVIENGPVPPRKQIDHRCKRRMCVNPNHLQMVTHLRNQRLRDERRAA